MGELMETVNGEFIEICLEEIKCMSREQLVKYLEARGFACYDDESTDLLREAAIEDWEGEI